MSWTLVEVTKPHRCCGRCGATPADVRKMGWDCTAYGVRYDHHIWIWWAPTEEGAGSSGE